MLYLFCFSYRDSSLSPFEESPELHDNVTELSQQPCYQRALSNARLILVVDDEKDIVHTLEYNLNKAGYTTRSALNGTSAIETANTKPIPDLIVLDLMLPDISGNEVCRRLRSTEATQRIPIIMLTAKGEELDRVVGFELGADDYVVKPFSIRELLLRIEAILKRTIPPATKLETTTFGDLRVDHAGHRVWVGDLEISLTALEFKLLATFIDRKGRVQSRNTLLADVWGIDADVTTRTVDTHVKRLREKLGQAGQYIETLRGVGYRFRERGPEHAPCSD